MHVVKNSEKACCTCDHWTGIRVSDTAGFVFTFENLEGFCRGVKREVHGVEFDIALTFPDTRCNSWGRWTELDS